MALPEELVTLPSKPRDAMDRPLWRLLDTEPLEGIGPGRGDGRLQATATLSMAPRRGRGGDRSRFG